MNKRLGYLGATALALVLMTGNAMAETATANEMQFKSILRPLLWSVTFAAVGMVAAFIAIKIFDKATPKIDIQKELLNNNIAVAILTGAVVIGVCIIVAASISG